MRPELTNPFDPCKFRQALPLTEAVYDLLEAGRDYAEELEQLSRMVGHAVGRIDVLGAFGSIGPDEFAKQLTIDWNTIPTGLSDPELLELVEAICNGRASETTLDYWIRCLALNTGDDRISDLLYWPEDYLGGRYDGRALTPAEILDIALDARRQDASHAAV